MVKFHTISTHTARELIWSQRLNGNGRIFSVAFRRRTNRRDGSASKGDMQVLQVRFNVRKGLKTPLSGWVHPDGAIRRGWSTGARPAGASYDRAQKNVFCVYVIGRKFGDGFVNSGEKGCYRSIPFDGVRWLKLDGVIYRVGEAPAPQH